jgi:UDP-glucose 4-epimerase
VLVSRRAADITSAREVLRWEPKISLVEGMTELVSLPSA